jgi:hypothetical protein
LRHEVVESLPFRPSDAHSVILLPRQKDAGVLCVRVRYS